MQGLHDAKRVIQVLRGDSDPFLASNGLTALSTFGLLSQIPSATLSALIDVLEAEGCILASPDDARRLSLTARGVRVVRREEPNFRTLWP